VPSIMDRIGSLYDELSPQQKLIADRILSKTYIPEFLTAKALASRLGISSSTVVRFAYKLGFDGYPALSRELQQLFYEESSPMKKIRESLLNSEAIENPLMQTSVFERENIRQAEILNPPEKIASVLEVFRRGGKVVFMGARAAFSLAYYAGFLFNQLEERFSFMNSFADDAYERILRLDPASDSLFVISFHRYVKKTTELAQFARKRGVAVLALSDSPYSALSRLADHALLAPNKASFFSYVSAMTVLDCLLSSYAKGVGGHVRSSFEDQNKILLENDVFV